MAALSSAQLRSFRDDGFLVIPGFFEEAELDYASAAYDSVWETLPADVVVDSAVTGRRVRIEDLTDEERKLPFKINDLYLRDEKMRDAIMSVRLGAILRELFAEEPVVINTLSVEYGTQQPDHLDTLFMTPPSTGRLLASWMALEDADENAGPLRFYPESNHIEPYRFEDGGYHVREAEMEQWADYMAGAVDRHGLVETRFLAQRGDLFVWDAWLLHGGSEIATPGLSRRSVITHYFTRSDCGRIGADLQPAQGGWWMKRPPPPVPGETPERTAAFAAESEPIPAELAPLDRGPLPLPARSLRDRLETLDPADR
jgi:phytanoyl-CoA hydroxylase